MQLELLLLHGGLRLLHDASCSALGCVHGLLCGILNFVNDLSCGCLCRGSLRTCRFDDSPCFRYYIRICGCHGNNYVVLNILYKVGMKRVVCHMGIMYAVLLCVLGLLCWYCTRCGREPALGWQERRAIAVPVKLATQRHK